MIRRTDSTYRLFASPHRGRQSGESDRLALFESCFDKWTTESLAGISIKKGWDVLEVGAGRGSISRLLAGMVGPTGSVTATDIAPDLVVAAGIANLQVVRHDLMSDPLPLERFNVVHARSVLHLFSDKQAVVDKLVSSLKPGGWLVVEDLDPRPMLAGDSPLSEVWRAMNGLAMNFGLDLSWARMLGSLLQQAEMVRPTASRIEMMIEGNTDLALLWKMTLLESWDLIRSAGIDPETFDYAIRLLGDSQFRCCGPSFVSYRSMKPDHSERAGE